MGMLAKSRRAFSRGWPIFLQAAVLVAMTYVVIMVLLLPLTVYKLESADKKGETDVTIQVRVRHKLMRSKTKMKSSARNATGGNASSWSTVSRVAEEINSDPVLLSLPPLWDGARGTIYTNTSWPPPVERCNLLEWANELSRNPAALDKDRLGQLERAARKAADKRLLAKGQAVKYSHVYGSLTSKGSFYAYNHSGQYERPCSLHRISLKFDSDCGDDVLASKDVRKLLVVAVQRSGTHYTWEMLNRLGVSVHHEGVGPAGAVSWFFAANAVSTKPSKAKESLQPAQRLTAMTYPINNPVRLARQRFLYIMHQVRHPLRVINTVVNRCRGWDKYWSFASSVYGMGNLSAAQTPLRRAMLLYLLWNRHIERYADLRFRGEATSPRDVCTWARFKEELCRSNGEFSTANGTIVEPEAAVEGGLGEGGEGGGASEEEMLVGSSRRDAEADALLEEEEERQRAKLRREASRGLRVRKSDPARDPVRPQKHRNRANRARTFAPTVLPTPAPVLVVTWADILREDSALGAELIEMCIEYGYPLDPEQLPQSEQSRLFTA